MLNGCMVLPSQRIALYAQHQFTSQQPCFLQWF